jgi:hypothetical protein
MVLIRIENLFVEGKGLVIVRRFAGFPQFKISHKPVFTWSSVYRIENALKIDFIRQRLLKNHFIDWYSVSLRPRKPTFLSVYGRNIPCILFYPDSGTQDFR